MAKWTQDEVDLSVLPAFADIYIENETLEDCAQDTWYSPTTGQVGPAGLINFSYSGGSLTYTGDEDITVVVIQAQASTTTGSTVTTEITNGKNGSPCLVGSMPSSTAIFGGGQIIPNATICVFPLSNGDTLDAYIRQTSETGTVDITYEKLRFVVVKIGPNLIV